MQSVIFSAVLDAIAALKAGSKGLPNNLLRDVQAIHPNVTFADLPKELQDAIAASTRTAFTQLLKEGYSVAPKDAGSTRAPPRHARTASAASRRSPWPSSGRRPTERPRRQPPPAAKEGLARHQQRQLARRQHGPRYAAEQILADPAVPVGAHHDQPRADRFRFAQ